MYVEDIAAMLLFKIFTPHKKRENPYTYSYDTYVPNTQTHTHTQLYGEKVNASKHSTNQTFQPFIVYIYTTAIIRDDEAPFFVLHTHSTLLE